MYFDAEFSADMFAVTITARLTTESCSNAGLPGSAHHQPQRTVVLPLPLPVLTTSRPRVFLIVRAPHLYFFSCRHWGSQLSVVNSQLF
jgi:hypothetical protein